MKEYYNQADNRWANHLYTSPTHPQANLKTSGCGPTSAAMIVTNMVKRVLPNEMADIFKNNGYRANEGTSLEAFNWLGRNYNLEVKNTSNINEAVQCLKYGGMVVASLSPGGLFSTNGHIVVLVEMKDANRIVVYDPYLYSGKFNQLGRQGKVEVNGNEVYCSIDNFQKYAKCQAYFCYRKQKEIKIKSFLNTDEKIIKIQKEIEDRERGRKCGFSLSGSMFFCISGRICGFDCRRRRTDLTSGIYDRRAACTYSNCNK